MGVVPRGVATELGGVDVNDDQDRFLNLLGFDTESGLTPWDTPVLQPRIAPERGAEDQEEGGAHGGLRDVSRIQEDSARKC